jgi:hypothetical protein
MLYCYAFVKSTLFIEDYKTIKSIIFKSSFYNKSSLEKVTNKGVNKAGKISKSFLGFVICSSTFMRANCKVV